jgi:hypothetical protein
MIEVLPPLEKYKYDTWTILPVKCYIDNSVRLWSCIRNVNKKKQDGKARTFFVLAIQTSRHRSEEMCDFLLFLLGLLPPQISGQYFY